MKRLSLFVFLCLGSVVFAGKLHGQKLSVTSAEVDSLNEKGYELWIRSPIESIEYGEKAAELASEINYPKGLASAYRVQGVAYWAVGDPKLALENLNKSVDLYVQLEDQEGIANVKLNTGMVYADIEEDSIAMSLYEDALNGFTALNLQSRIATTFTKIGSLQLKTNLINDALNNFSNALKIHTDKNFTYGMSEVHNRLGLLYIIKGELGQADYHIRKSLALGREIDDEDGLLSNMLLFGKLTRLSGELAASETHLKFALKKAQEKKLNNYRLDALDELKNLWRDQNKADSALFYAERYAALKDSMFSITKSRQISAIEFAHELKEKNARLAHLTESERVNSQIKWVLIVGIWCIVLLAFFLIMSQRQRNKSQKELLLKQEELASKEKENARLKHQDLEDELEDKNKELTSYTLNFVQKNELLKKLEEKVSSLKKSAVDPNTKAQLQDLDRLIRQHSAVEKDWEDFKFHFEKTHSNFFISLKNDYPDLSSNDLKVAALTRLNLSIKEMSSIMGISPESSKTARYRLRKKLNIKPEEELFDYLLRTYQ